MSNRCPVERLTPEESSKIHEIIDAKGKREALGLLGLRDMCALMKAAAGFDIHRLTAQTIRAKLALLMSSQAQTDHEVCHVAR